MQLPLCLYGTNAREQRQRAAEMLERFGLGPRQGHKPAELSAGQQQRVALARTLVTKPQLVLADEPTANLDSRTGSEIISVMRQMQQQEHVSFIFSSHDPKVLEAADDAVHIHDGRITSIERRLAQAEATG